MSKLLQLSWQDFFKGLVMAIIGGVLITFEQMLKSGGVIDFKQILNVALLTGVGYLIKQYFTDDTGKVFGINLNK